MIKYWRWVLGETPHVFVVRWEFSYIFCFSSVKDSTESRRENERGEGDEKKKRCLALAPRRRATVLPFLVSFKPFFVSLC